MEYRQNIMFGTVTYRSREFLIPSEESEPLLIPGGLTIIGKEVSFIDLNGPTRVTIEEMFNLRDGPVAMDDDWYIRLTLTQVFPNGVKNVIKSRYENIAQKVATNHMRDNVVYYLDAGEYELETAFEVSVVQQYYVIRVK